MLAFRLRQSLITMAVAIATVAGTSALFGAAAEAQGPDTGTGNAYGINVQLLGGDLLGPIPAVTLGPDGQPSSLMTTLPVDLPGVITANTLNADTTSTNFSDANETITSNAGVEGLSGLLGLSVLNPLLNVDAINTTCTSSAVGSTGSTTVVGLSIGGSTVDIPSPVPPNTGLTAAQLGPLAGLVTITLNKQTVVNTPNNTSIDVIGLQITLLSALHSGVVINAAHSFCQASGPDILAPPTVTSVVPNFGPKAGGTNVTITGTGFIPTSTVDFGTNAATNVAYVSPTEMTATSPADPTITNNTTVPVVVGNNFGSSCSTPTPACTFTYEVQPSTTSIVPSAGPTTGGQAFTINGANLGPDSTVSFGGNAATDVVVAPGGASLTGVTPAGTAGPVNVTVTDAGGTSSPPLTYTYITSNINVTGISPQFGPTAGGTKVTIMGNGFTATSAQTSVAFGTGNPATDVTVVSPTEVTAVSPAHTAGTVDVQVTTPGGTSPAVVADQFTYLAAPTIATTNGIVPNLGPVAGGTNVTITGTNFAAGDPNLAVDFGANAATNVVVVSPTTITATSPASTTGPGPVNVTVTTSGGTSNPQTFTYIAAPTITTVNGIVPDMGPTAGGTNVTITGTNFPTSTALGGPATVTFAGNLATNVVVVSATKITATSPPGVAGVAEVIVSDAGGPSNQEPFTYVGPPTIGVNGLNPAFGPTAGGQTVTLSGTGLTGISAVVFDTTSCTSAGAVGGTPGTSVTGISDTDATVVTPAHAAGAVPVCVTADGGTAQALELYTYEATPTIGADGINPDQGPVGGGTNVTITGTNFAVGDTSTQVNFNGALATDVVVVSSTTITAVSPMSPLPAPGTGMVNVTVSDGGGTSNSEPYTYVASPVVSGINPTSGPNIGGETVIIKGSDLCENPTSGNPTVMFGNARATVKSVSADCTTVTVVEPPGTGSVPVVVTTAGGSALSPENFTYISPGYWMSASDGGVFAFGGAQFYGSMGGKPLNQPIVAMADTPDHGGYWLFAADGGVFAFGDANFDGSVPGVLGPQHRTLNGPIVAAEATPDGGGYRMFATDGGVFDFGDALFEGSLPGLFITPSAPIESATTYPFGAGPNPNNAGYWLVGKDGAIYAFGNAPSNLGSGYGQTVAPVVSLATTPTGNGYWIFQSNGSVLSFGDASSGLGQINFPINAPIVFGQATSTGNGYWMFGADGGVYTFGDAPYEGSLGNIHLNKPINGAIGFGSLTTGG